MNVRLVFCTGTSVDLTLPVSYNPTKLWFYPSLTTVLQCWTLTFLLTSSLWNLSMQSFAIKIITNYKSWQSPTESRLSSLNLQTFLAVVDVRRSNCVSVFLPIAPSFLPPFSRALPILILISGTLTLALSIMVHLSKLSHIRGLPSSSVVYPHLELPPSSLCVIATSSCSFKKAISFILTQKLFSYFNLFTHLLLINYYLFLGFTTGISIRLVGSTLYLLIHFLS